MVVGRSRQETLDPGFVLHGTRQQGVPVILRELVLPVDSISSQPITFLLVDSFTVLRGSLNIKIFSYFVNCTQHSISHLWIFTGSEVNNDYPLV
ncbi:unnamed protein product [Schistosoma mattheei]|uniref:Uncharacterized protein n=1 Tax=Schistosoma mattheei TaxID=31246 RepID=A0A183NWV4_9TREM|nr:unnamed protein product [Schistosoma mattheei]